MSGGFVPSSWLPFSPRPPPPDSAGSHLVFVPSLRDAHHDCIYPQAPFACYELAKEDKKVPAPVRFQVLWGGGERSLSPGEAPELPRFGLGLEVSCRGLSAVGLL